VFKLGLLALAGLWLVDKLAMTIYATWVIGSLISLGVLAGYAIWQGRFWGCFKPQWTWLRRLGGAALAHHALNLALQAPGLILPLIVTAILSAQMNAYFYVAWMIAGFAFVISSSLTTTLYAVGAANPAALAQKARFTLKLSFGVGLLVSIALLVGANWVLGLFKGGYSQEASGCLRILALAVFPVTIRNHYIAISRVHGHLTNTALWMTAGGVLELILAGIGASLGGLIGLSIGWLVAVCIEAIAMLPGVYRVMTSKKITVDQRVGEVVPPPPDIPAYRVD
jgi:O-antigen/teichoic acid export membrane protein